MTKTEETISWAPAEARVILGQHYKRVRVTRSGEVHCYGRIPNSNRTGWFYYSPLKYVHERLWG